MDEHDHGGVLGTGLYKEEFAAEDGLVDEHTRRARDVGDERRLPGVDGPSRIAHAFGGLSGRRS